MLKKPPDFGGLTHKIRKIVFSCFRCPVFAFLVSRLTRYFKDASPSRLNHRNALSFLRLWHVLFTITCFSF